MPCHVQCFHFEHSGKESNFIYFISRHFSVAWLSPAWAHWNILVMQFKLRKSRGRDGIFFYVVRGILGRLTFSYFWGTEDVNVGSGKAVMINFSGGSTCEDFMWGWWLVNLKVLNISADFSMRPNDYIGWQDCHHAVSTAPVNQYYIISCISCQFL